MDPAPLVVLDDARHRVIAADAQAGAAGVRIGMTLGAALAAAPDIDARPRDAARELEIMQRLAGIAATFTPLVSLDAPDGLLLEIKSSIRLFGGLRELCRSLRDACRASSALVAQGCITHFTLAPTALAALVAARAGARCFITDPRALPARLKPLPVAVLRWSEEDNARLTAMGVRTVGELMRLPRAGFTKRFGKDALLDLDRLLGRRADPRRRLARRERFRERLDLDHEVESEEQILQALQPLLAALEHYLRVRQRGITALQCRLHHYRAPPTVCTLRLAQPEAHAERLSALLRERLTHLALPEPVRRCELLSGALTGRRLASRALWAPGERGHAPADELPALVEHLRARLGASAVYGLRRHPEHRPEHAWRVAEPVLAPAPAVASAGNARGRDAMPVFRRPPWLLREAEPLTAHAGRPQYHGALELLEGPERVESGWWDGPGVRRDYYVAQSPAGARLWVYRECAGARRWFLQGIFG